SCGHCIHTIKSELSEIAGVISVDADLELKNVKVVFESPATESSIKDLLFEINYPPEKP
ncbi:MAG: heavy-metal-associated domain-containing protein, partial [Anaerolineaceae bacterium]|nr:heavy-metal-associated domain-containing protein [Anaerolineaceae bacterium]